ncbi:lipopolysaccharide biosynthesis protein [Marinifilum caeruleilacunae]|uniref:Lipopolysaccharide biosynthesis protein n=1 Tax=Marinifilum caeruleilacunae TaxID=2499076 RepID=A0ABX1WQQ4_9BACT|nr:oligosaccharide flippase family protein [Marinifilum caeruleilacunae]NOU58420.1 hypothetical protein [Marinifilum caeruleilacunae]
MKNSLLKDFLSYGVVGVMAKFVGFITIPIYARFLSQADFGILEIISILMAFLPFFTTLQLESSFLRLYFEKDSPKEQGKLFSSGFWLLVPCSILLTLVMLVFNQPLSAVFFKSSSYYLIFIIATSELLFKNVLGYCTIIYRVEFNRKAYTSFYISYVILNAIAGIFFIVVLDKGLQGLLLSRLIVTIIFSLIALYNARAYIRWFYSWKIAKEMLQYGIPLIPSVIAKWAQKYLPGIVIFFIFSIQQMGIFAMATKVVLPLFLLTQSLKLAWHPYSFENYQKSDSKTIFNDFYNVYSLIGSLIVIVLLFFGKEVLVLFASEKFIESQELVGVIAMTYILGGMSDLLSAGILIKKKNIILSYSAIISTSLSCLFMYFLSLEFGLIGIVIGGLIGEIVKYFIIAYFVNEHFKDYFKYWRTSIGLILLLVMVIASNFVGNLSLFGFRLILCCLSLAFISFVYFYKNNIISRLKLFW